MSDSVRPHRQQPTRLSHPWDSPGKNTGVGCHFLLQCMKMRRESEVVQSCPTLRDPTDCSPPGSSVHGIFQARVLEWSAIAFSEMLPYFYFQNRLVFQLLSFLLSNSGLLCVFGYQFFRKEVGEVFINIFWNIYNLISDCSFLFSNQLLGMFDK